MRLTNDRRFLEYSMACLAISALAGCTSIDTVRQYEGAEPLPRPSVVVVKDFAYAKDDVSLNSGVGAEIYRDLADKNHAAEELKLGKAVADALAKKLVSKIQDTGLTAQRYDAASPPTGNYLMLEGQFTSIDEGNRMTRMVIGLGFGKSAVKTHVQVYDYSASGRTLAQEFSTVAHSSYKPGAAETMGVGAATGKLAAAAAATAGLGVASETLSASVEAEAERTATDLVKKMKTFFVEQGWIRGE